MGAAASWALGVAFGDAGCVGKALATFQSGYDIVTRSGQGAHLSYLIGDRHLSTLLMLLGRKLSTPAIADRLTLSRRTVESHIYRAVAKTGVANREQLAALLSGTPRRLD